MAPSSKLAKREAIMQSSMSDAPGLPLLAIRGYLCFRCLEHAEKLLRCKGCQRAVYCSKECQANDWRIVHRHLCKSLREVNDIERQEDAEHRPWEVYTESLLAKSQVAKANARNLDRNKIDELGQIVAGQPYCTGCHLTQFQLSCKGMTLYTCGNCHTAAICSRCPQDHPKEVCRHYQLLGALEQFRLNRFEHLGTTSVIQPVGDPCTLEDYRPLSSYEDWSDFFNTVPIRAMVGDQTMEEPIHQLMATNSSTISITILAALEACVSDLLDRESITLHLVGAAGREAQHLMLFEDILHLLPRLKRLHILLSGPNVSSQARNPDPGHAIELDCCPDCQILGKRRSIALQGGLYHEYASTPAFCKPDLAVLFHSGRSQEAVESWAPTTRTLVSSGIRTLCTTYSKTEATEEAAELDQLKANFILRPEENKWRGLCPFPEFLEDAEHSAYYMNYFWYIFEGRKECRTQPPD